MGERRRQRHFDCLNGRRLGRGLTPETAVLRVERQRSIHVVLPAHAASDREARRMRRCLGEV
jgi:hypothetical protein